MKPPLQKLLIAGLAAMTLMLAIPARAQSPGPQKGIAPCDSPINDRKSGAEATKQAHVFIAWIAAQTHWIVQETPPIRLIPTEEIQKRFTAEDPTGLHIAGFYSEKDHSIYLPDRWQPTALRDRSILLHELVHHLQYLNASKRHARKNTNSKHSVCKLIG